MNRRNFLQTAVSVPVAASAQPASAPRGSGPFPEAHFTLAAAEARAGGNILIIDTGVVRRHWIWTRSGLLTTGFRHHPTGREWAGLESQSGADWDHPGLLGPESDARLLRFTLRPVRFDPFTSDRVEAVARIEYPDARLLLEYVIWAYPNAPGIRTQLRAKALSGFDASTPTPQEPPAADTLPVKADGLNRRAIGYYNHTQRRNTRETEILREDISPEGALYDWASILCLEDAGDGVCLLKESHKCVNQTGVDTGDFRLNEHGLRSTGWGPALADLLEHRFRDCWASWAIAYSGGDQGRQFAIKELDRARYPVDPHRDIYIMANTWGSGAEKAESLEASREENILRQIESCRDLGIDVQQIDDGWQGNQYKTWFPVEERYPEGWKNVREAAREAGVKLGLWAAWVIGPDALHRTYDRGGFNSYKIDFANLDTYDKLEDLVGKMRGLIEHSGHTVRVNWDVTENPPRVGYYYARDLGNVYLENRKPLLPAHVVYVPYLVLRDAWHVAHYTNLNRFQITVQNIDRVNREVSNAYQHNHPYAVAITLMGSPIFFQETTYYSQEARDQIRPLLAIYKDHRQAMYRGYVFPIGAEPDDASWTGFQNHDAKAGSGYLTVFRELECRQEEGEFRLWFVAGRTIRLTDLIGGDEREMTVPKDGVIRFTLDSAPAFRFLRYQLV